MGAINFSLNQEMRLPPISGGSTISIFPEVENLLGTDEYLTAFIYVARFKNKKKYWSIIDFLFCELFTKWKPACFAFYVGNGPKLKELIDEEEKENYNQKIKQALEIAKALLESEQSMPKRRHCWFRFRKIVFNCF